MPPRLFVARHTHDMDQKQMEDMAVRLPGLRLAVRLVMQALNEARATLGMPVILLDLEGPTTTRRSPPIQDGVAHDGNGNGHATVKHISDKQKQQIASTARERWALVKEAGIETRRMPSAEMVEKAKKIIARRAKRSSVASVLLAGCLASISSVVDVLA